MSSTLKIMVRGAYDEQKLRIEMGNRLVANFRSKLGLEPSDENNDVMKTLERRYYSITEGVIDMSRKRKFEYDGVISTYSELLLVGGYLEMLSHEKRMFKNLVHELRTLPIYTEFLDGVAGCGPAMAGVIISEIDITKAKYVSSLWKYAGLDVGPDGRGRSRRAEHLVDVEYTNAKGEQAKRRSITFNPFLKTKLVGVLGPSFLKVKESPYKQAYYDYKHRLENHSKYKDVSKGHRHNMAIRYAVKLFLVDLYAKWRALEGLEVHPPYSEAKLGLTHGRQAA